MFDKVKKMFSRDSNVKRCDGNESDLTSEHPISESEESPSEPKVEPSKKRRGKGKK